VWSRCFGLTVGWLKAFCTVYLAGGAAKMPHAPSRHLRPNSDKPNTGRKGFRAIKLCFEPRRL
jgi:hypothetical protein